MIEKKKVIDNGLTSEIKKLSDEHSEAFTTFSEIEGAIIRGHILIEKALNRSILLTVINKSDFDPDKFTFAQKVHISNMFGISDNFRIELNAINKLRNQIAHSLSFEEKYVDIIINEVQKKSVEIIINKHNRLASFMMAISFMCGYMVLGYERAKNSFFIRQVKEIKDKEK